MLETLAVVLQAAILVATQVIEQSLDLDFDTVAERFIWLVLCCHLRLFSRGRRTSTLDGLRNLQGRLGGREVRGVDDLGLVV
ncbi:hypothetical protein ACFY05_27230 [Microtetraspora fusca]|uniref:CRISPR-associated nuclease/helicase Cas3 domain-containing protein n=1 Tax=Microtetraspora fusca TaxID=1997 RepID=A0ABW6VB60_MICFU